MIDRELLEAVLYDWENTLTLDRQNRDVGFYLRLLGRHRSGPQDVLELACGTGRVTIPLAAAGHRLTGVDLSPGRIELARMKSRGLPIDWQIADMRTWQPSCRFDAVLVPYSSFLLLSSAEDRSQTLSAIRDALYDSGFAVIDISPNFRAKRESAHELALSGRSELLRAHVDYYESVTQHGDATGYRKEYRIVPDAGAPFTAEFYECWHHLGVAAMQSAIAGAGLAISAAFGGYEETPFPDAGAYKHIYVLSRDNSRRDCSA